MKRIAVFLLVLCLTLSLFACAKGDESIPQGYLDAGTQGVEYRFFYPDTWVLDRHDPGMTSVYVSETDFSNVSVTAFTASPDYATLADYAENYYFQNFEDNFKNLTLVYNQDGSLKLRALKVDECDAVAVDYSALFAGDNYQFRSFFISFNGSIYTVTYTALQSNFESHTDAVEGMIEQMRFQ